jgi:acyl carrier protein
MTKDEILAGVSEIIRDVLDNPGLVITMETQANEVEDWDSVNHISIVVGIEQKFGIKFKTAEIEDLRNVGELVELIERLKS